MSELRSAAYWIVTMNLAAVALLHNPPGGSGSAALVWWFTILGAMNEVLGLVLVAWPEINPRRRRAAGWLRKKASLLLTRPSSKVIQVGGAGSAGLAGTATLKITPGEGVRAQIAWIGAKIDEHSEQLRHLEGAVEEMPVQWRLEIQEAVANVETRSRDALHELAERHIEIRLVGLVVIASGIVLAAIANLV